MQLSCDSQLWGGGHGNVIVHAKAEDWTCSHIKNYKGLRTTLSWSVWQGVLALHEYCAVLDSLWNTWSALQSLSFDFLTIIPGNYNKTFTHLKLNGDSHDFKTLKGFIDCLT